MALNHAMLHNRSPVPLADEITIKHVKDGVELKLTIPPPGNTSGSSSAGASDAGKTIKLKEMGGLWLTDQRLIFLSQSEKPTISSGLSLASLTVPLHSILSTSFGQPVLHSNFLLFSIKPTEGGGLYDGTTAEIRFKDRAMFEFVSLLEKTREKAIYMKRQTMEDDDGLPSYTSPGEASSTSTAIHPIGIPNENPPGYDA